MLAVLDSRSARSGRRRASGPTARSTSFTGALDHEAIHIHPHEGGHAFGLGDRKRTLRDFWRHLKSRYGY
ncbi:hypothetical protein QWJ26_05540 [Streptomyces sp. CSDS2]|uniref:hypothetical protein n=1 Tax=Streptomyces sp. CSDS2 TaxID=3055051 RepID=UPI0025B1A12E|nr:hypothetical protein [Streptomyces sp. CSDS2]MDN3259283.1 hypothetical protein [Streptomyces sp. CSDS2]